MYIYNVIKRVPIYLYLFDNTVNIIYYQIEYDVNPSVMLIQDYKLNVLCTNMYMKTNP